MIQRGFFPLQVSIRATNNSGGPFEALRSPFTDEMLDIANVNFCDQVSLNEVACCYIVSQSDTEVKEVTFKLELDVPQAQGTTHRISEIK